MGHRVELGDGNWKQENAKRWRSPHAVAVRKLKRAKPKFLPLKRWMSDEAARGNEAAKKWLS